MKEFPNKKRGTLPGDGDRIDRASWKVMVVPGGLPDPVLYPTEVGTTYDKYMVETAMLVWRDIHSKEGADPDQVMEWKTHEAEGFRRTNRLAASIALCRRRSALEIEITISFDPDSSTCQLHLP